MNLSSQRRMAAEILKCGENRVRIDPDAPGVASAITRDDVRRLIEDGRIEKKPVKGTSRGRARETAKKKHRGQRKGPGSRKGSSNARLNDKKRWMEKIRVLRRMLAGLRRKGVLEPGQYRKLYKMASGGFFRDKAHLKIYLEKQGVKL